MRYVKECYVFTECHTCISENNFKIIRIKSCFWNDSNESDHLEMFFFLNGVNNF